MISCNILRTNQRQRQLPRSGGAHVLNVKLWGWGPRLCIIRLHESKLYA